MTACAWDPGRRPVPAPPLESMTPGRDRATPGWQVTYTSPEAPGASITVDVYAVTRYSDQFDVNSRQTRPYMSGYGVEAAITYRTASGGTDSELVEYDTESYPGTWGTVDEASGYATELAAAYHANEVPFLWDGCNLLEES